jgi:hypothetical protein
MWVAKEMCKPLLAAVQPEPLGGLSSPCWAGKVAWKEGLAHTWVSEHGLMQGEAVSRRLWRDTRKSWYLIVMRQAGISEDSKMVTFRRKIVLRRISLLEWVGRGCMLGQRHHTVL